MLKPVLVKRGFKCWNAGDKAGFPADEVAALVKGGYVVPVDPETGEPIAITEEADAPAPVEPDADEVEIPADWAEMHHMKIIALAKDIDDTVTDLDSAKAAIEAELELRAEAAGPADPATTVEE